MTEFNENQLRLILKAEFAEFRLKLVDQFVSRLQMQELQAEVHEIALNIKDENEIRRLVRDETSRQSSAVFKPWSRFAILAGVVLWLASILVQIYLAKGGVIK